MGNIEASIKTHNRMADSIRSATIEMSSLTAGAEKMEMVYDLVNSVLQTANIKIDELIASLHIAPKAFKTANSAANQLGNTLKNAENHFKAFGKSLVLILMREIPFQPTVNTTSKEFSKAEQHEEVVNNVTNGIRPNKLLKLSNTWHETTGEMTDNLSVKLTPALDMNQMSKLEKKIKSTTRVACELPFQSMMTISKPNMRENNPNNTFQNLNKEVVGNEITKRIDTLSVKVEPILDMKQFNATLIESRKKLISFGKEMDLLYKRMSGFSMEKAMIQTSKLGRKTKTAAKIVRRPIPIPRAANTPNTMTNHSISAPTNSDTQGIGSKMAGGLSKGFGMAAKGVGIVKGALNKIAPDRMAKLSDMWNNAFGSMAASLSVKLAPAFDKLEQFMMSPAFQTFMSNIEAAISCLIPVFTYMVGLAEPLLDIMNQAFSLIIENSGTISAVLMAIAGTIALITLVMTLYNGVLLIQSTIASIAAGENAKLNAIMAMNPAIFIVGAIIALIMILLTLIATVQPVREAFAKLAESFIGFAENGINSFLEALAGLSEGILKFAGGAINTFLDIFVNPFIDAINMVMGACNKIFGTDFKQLERISVDFSGKAESISEAILSKTVDFSDAKKAVGEGIRNFDANKIKSKITGAFELGSEKAGTNLEQHNPYAQSPAMAAGPQANNDVTMQDQDMQMLREVAERESINRYTTMTPSVKIDVGSIHENADAEKIIQEIVNRIIQEMEASAKGVVTV